MNYKNAKTSVISESVRNTLINDNVNTGEEVREITYYTSKVYKSKIVVKDKKLAAEKNYPQIVYTVDGSNSGILLDTGVYHMVISPHFDSESSGFPQDELDNIAQRIIFLLDRKPKELNSRTNKNLRCRIVKLISNVIYHDITKKLIYRDISFELICDDENVNT